jgi:hypothetical protein
MAVNQIHTNFVQRIVPMLITIVAVAQKFVVTADKFKVFSICEMVVVSVLN